MLVGRLIAGPGYPESRGPNSTRGTWHLRAPRLSFLMRHDYDFLYFLMYCVFIQVFIQVYSVIHLAEQYNEVDKIYTPSVPLKKA